MVVLAVGEAHIFELNNLVGLQSSKKVTKIGQYQEGSKGGGGGVVFAKKVKRGTGRNGFFLAQLTRKVTGEEIGQALKMIWL